MKDLEIAPSILAADFGYLMNDIKSVENDCEYLHIDVMDGHYVNNISFGIPVIQSIRKYTGMKFYTHLMITEPEKYIKAFADAGSDNITFHVECAKDPAKLIDEVFPIPLSKRSTMQVQDYLLPAAQYLILKTVPRLFRILSNALRYRNRRTFA